MIFDGMLDPVWSTSIIDNDGAITNVSHQWRRSGNLGEERYNFGKSCIRLEVMTEVTTKRRGVLTAQSIGVVHLIYTGGQ